MAGTGLPALLEQWFKLADADADGKVGGAEAVQFFMRSGLHQAVLGQVNLASRFALPPLQHAAPRGHGAKRLHQGPNCFAISLLLLYLPLAHRFGSFPLEAMPT